MTRYNETDAWAYGMLDSIATFVARSDINEHGWKRLKELVPQYCKGERAIEAAIMQFMVQLDHINENERRQWPSHLKTVEASQ